MFLLYALWLLFACGCRANTLEFDETFVGGKSPAADVCTAWRSFISAIPPTMGSVEVSDGTTVYANCEDVVKASHIAQALHTEEASGDGETVVVECESQVWAVGRCWTDSVELLVRPVGSPTDICECHLEDAVVVRPCIGNNNWGGLNGRSCAAPSQRMAVTFTTADESYSW